MSSSCFNANVIPSSFDCLSLSASCLPVSKSRLLASGSSAEAGIFFFIWLSQRLAKSPCSFFSISFASERKKRLSTPLVLLPIVSSKSGIAECRYRSSPCICISAFFSSIRLRSRSIYCPA